MRRVRRPVLAALTGVLVPFVLVPALWVSAARGGPGLNLGPAVFQIHKVDSAHFPNFPTEPFFVLVLGNDARPGETVSRADALHLIGVNPSTGQATILNIPRDTWVNIPGRGMDKVNAAHALGGPELQARTIGAMVGVQVSYVVSTGFEGFMHMVDDLGGVPVDLPMGMADANSGAYFSAGPQMLDGWSALAVARNRNLPGGDFRRSENQALLILAGLAKLQNEQGSPAHTLSHVAVLLRHARFDGASLPDVYRLARLALKIDHRSVRSVTMPGYGGSAGSASVVFVAAEARSLFADLADDGVLQSH